MTTFPKHVDTGIVFRFLDSLSESEQIEWLNLFHLKHERHRIQVQMQNAKAREKKRMEHVASAHSPWTYSTEHGTMCQSCRKSISVMPRANGSTLGRGCMESRHWDRWVRRVSLLPSYLPDSQKHPRPRGAALVDLHQELDEEEWNEFLKILSRNEGNIRKSVSEWRSHL